MIYRRFKTWLITLNLWSEYWALVPFLSVCSPHSRFRIAKGRPKPADQMHEVIASSWQDIWQHLILSSTGIQSTPKRSRNSKSGGIILTWIDFNSCPLSPSICLSNLSFYCIRHSFCNKENEQNTIEVCQFSCVALMVLGAFELMLPCIAMWCHAAFSEAITSCSSELGCSSDSSVIECSCVAVCSEKTLRWAVVFKGKLQAWKSVWCLDDLRHLSLLCDCRFLVSVLVPCH